MAASPPQKARCASTLQKLWDRTWWIFGTLFSAANIWLWSRHGEWALLGAYAALPALAGAASLLYDWRAWNRAAESRHRMPLPAAIVRQELAEEEPGGPGAKVPARIHQSHRPPFSGK